MSDDTPTQRYPEGFPPGAADAPTERFTTPAAMPGAPVPPPGGPAGPGLPPADDGRRQKRLVIALAVIGGVLLLAVIALLVWIASMGSGAEPEPTTSTSSPPPTPSATPTPTPAESATPTPTPTQTETVAPPPPPAGAIASFTASTNTVDCTASGGNPIPVAFSWDANGKQLWFGIGTTDAHAAPYDSYQLKDTQTFDYQCNQSSGKQIYTVTVQKADDTFESKALTIREI